MKNLIKILTIFLIISVLAGGIYFIIWNKKKTERNDCIKECFYKKDTGFGRLYESSDEMLWEFKDRKFQTREQCIDYCMLVK